MNFNQLRFANAVAVTSSFSEAASRCCVTQPTLSNGIARLEQELGARLFSRTTREVRLTRFGQHMLPKIKSVLDARAELEAVAAAYVNPGHQLVRVGLSPLVDMERLSIVLNPYLRSHEMVEVFFKECYLDDLNQRLHDETIDIALRPQLGTRSLGDDFERRVFYQEQLYFLPPAPPTATYPVQLGPITVSEIIDETFVLTPNVCGLVTVTRDILQRGRRKMRAYPGQALSYQVMQDWATLGIGAAILPLSKISSKNRENARPILLGTGKPAVVKIEVIWKKRVTAPPHVLALRTHFRTNAPQILQGLDPCGIVSES